VILIKQHSNQRVSEYQLPSLVKVHGGVYLDPVWPLTSVEEGFTYVASEGADKLAHLSSTRSVNFVMKTSSIRSHRSRPNMLDSHMALMLLTFIEAGFIEVVADEIEKCHVRTREICSGGQRTGID
jgi:hypothetical protein